MILDDIGIFTTVTIYSTSRSYFGIGASLGSGALFWSFTSAMFLGMILMAPDHQKSSGTFIIIHPRDHGPTSCINLFSWSSPGHPSAHVGDSLEEPTSDLCWISGGHFSKNRDGAWFCIVLSLNIGICWWSMGWFKMFKGNSTRNHGFPPMNCAKCRGG